MQHPQTTGLAIHKVYKWSSKIKIILVATDSIISRGAANQCWKGQAISGHSRESAVHLRAAPVVQLSDGHSTAV